MENNTACEYSTGRIVKRTTRTIGHYNEKDEYTGKEVIIEEVEDIYIPAYESVYKPYVDEGVYYISSS